ncbi:DMT family transporter [Pseudomonas sp. F1_0610]|uniref:EamA family transporter n=1 Tax=Pseudomonas sp. F1_0610 TaxID=3114284 RepID=UPI0039C21CA2
MSLSVFVVVLAAALLHAIWNSIVKNGEDKLKSTALLALTTCILTAFALPFIELPHSQSWFYLGVSIVLQVVYYLLVALNYKLSDLSLSYPLMRGTAPVLVALVGVCLLDESLSMWGWLGIFLIALGIVSMAWSARKAAGTAGIILALLNATVIAAYTLVDGLGVRHAGSAISYAVWLFFLSTIPIVIWALAYHKQAFIVYSCTHWVSGSIAGLGSSLAYAMVLWAMLHAPIALVAALRETSIVFATLFAAWMLKEKISMSRFFAVVLIALGAVALRLA